MQHDDIIICLSSHCRHQEAAIIIGDKGERQPRMEPSVVVDHNGDDDAVLVKRHGFYGKKETVEEHCHWLCQSFQKKFLGVKPLSSEDFLNKTFKKEGIVLVDCRTDPEREVSVLEGSVSLDDFIKETTAGSNEKPHAVVTYCTIGYRSSMEAQWIQDQHDGGVLDVYSLDGIVSYTHALSKSENENDAPRIVDPSTGQPTKRVHTFASAWDFVHPDYESKQFSVLEVMLVLMQVGLRVMVRTWQHLIFTTTKKRKLE